MISVCEEHLIMGLHQLDVPHIKKLNLAYTTKKCFYCHKRANYKLFYDLPFEDFLMDNALKYQKKSILWDTIHSFHWRGIYSDQ